MRVDSGFVESVSSITLVRQPAFRGWRWCEGVGRRRRASNRGKEDIVKKEKEEP